MTSMISENLTIPRGRVLFGKYQQGTQSVSEWVDLGNCPELSATIDLQVVKLKESVGGRIFTDEVLVTESSVKMLLTTDNISRDNAMLWFNGQQNEITNSGFSFVSDSFVGGLGTYALSKRPISTSSLKVVFKPSNVELVSGFDYEYDQDFNVIVYLHGSSTSDLEVSYLASEHRVSDSQVDGNSVIEGELRFASKAPAGQRFNLTAYRVALTPSNSFSFIESPENIKWQTLSYDVEFLMKAGKNKLFSLEVEQEYPVQFGTSLAVNSVGEVLVLA